MNEPCSIAPACKSPIPPGEISIAMDKLIETIYNLEKLANDLPDKLQPILHESPQINSKSEAEEKSSVPLAYTINDQTDRIHSVCITLNRLLNEISL